MFLSAFWRACILTTVLWECSAVHTARLQFQFSGGATFDMYNKITNRQATTYFTVPYRSDPTSARITFTDTWGGLNCYDNTNGFAM